MLMREIRASDVRNNFIIAFGKGNNPHICAFF